MPRLGEGQFRATCEVCNRRFNANGLLGGHTICHRCYEQWYIESNAVQTIENWWLTQRR